MFRKALKWTFGILAILLVALSIFLVNLIWFRPWSLNLFYEKVFAKWFSTSRSCSPSLGLVEQFGITGHNGKLSDVSPAHQQKVVRSVEEAISADLREYPLEAANGVAAAFHACARLVPPASGRGRKVSVAQLSGESALRSAERVAVVHGEHASPARAAGLRILPPAARCAPDEVRSVARESEAARAESGFCRRVSWSRRCSRRWTGFVGAAGAENILVELVQDARRKDRETNRRSNARISKREWKQR